MSILDYQDDTQGYFTMEADSSTSTLLDDLGGFTEADSTAIAVDGDQDSTVIAPYFGVEADIEEGLPASLRSSLEVAFGGHDLGDVRVHTGPAAAETSESEEAHAFTRGTDIYFNAGEYKPGTPEGDRLIAHETAHVVQNKGVGTNTSVSAEGEADHAADVALSSMYGGNQKVASIGAAPSGAVMHKKKTKQAKPTKKDAPAIEEATLRDVSDALGKILVSNKSASNAGRFATGLLFLEYAVLEDDIERTADQRLTFLRASTALLDPAFKAMEAEQRYVSWMQSAKIKTRIADLRTDLNDQKAAARVENASLADASLALDANGAAAQGPDADAKRARAAISLHLKTAGKITDLANKAMNPSLGDDAGPAPPIDAGAKGLLALDALNDALSFASGMLELTDEEFEKKKASITAHPSFKNAATKAELSKAVLEVLNSAVGMTSKSARLVALQLGKQDLAAQLDGIAKSETLGNVIAVLTLVHSTCVLLDGASTDQEKLDAGVAGAGAMLSIGGGLAGGATGAILSGAGTVLGATYALMQLAASMYWGSMAGVTSLQLAPVFAQLAEDSSSLVRRSEKLVVTGILLAGEQDPDQIAALSRRETDDAEKLGNAIDWFLARARTYKMTEARVSNSRVLMEAFARHQGLVGRTDPVSVVEAATAIIETINWVFENASYIQAAEMKRGGLDTVNEMKEEDRREKEEEESRKAEDKAYYESLDATEEEEDEDWTVDDGYGL